MSDGKTIPGEDAIIGFSKSKKEEDIQGIALDKFTEAISTPRSTRTSQSYLNITRDLSEIDESGDYTSEDKVKNAIKLSYRLYELDGVVANTVDTFVEFGISDFQFHGVKNKKLIELLNYFKRNVNSTNPDLERGLVNVASYIALQHYLAGNEFIEPKWSKEQLRFNNGRNKSYDIITSIHFYDPQKITFDESGGNTPVLVEIKESLYNAVALLKDRGRAYIKKMIKNKFFHRGINERVLKIALELPESIVNSISKKNNGKCYIALENIDILQRKKAPWNLWGTPYTARAFKNIAIKHRLQALDMDTIDGLINLITIFKIGDKDRPASAGRLSSFASLMNNPSRSKFLVWAHDVTTESVGAKDNVMEMTERYKQIDAQILEDLGLPSAFTRLATNSAGDPWVQIVRLMERIMKNRKSISILFEDYATAIAEKNGFINGKDFENISIVWKRNNIMNPADIREFVVQLYDRGLISKTTAIYLTEGDLDKEIENRINEANTKISVDGENMSIEELLAPPSLPFSKNEKVPLETNENSRRPSKNDVNKDKTPKNTNTINNKK